MQNILGKKQISHLYIGVVIGFLISYAFSREIDDIFIQIIFLASLISLLVARFNQNHTKPVLDKSQKILCWAFLIFTISSTATLLSNEIDGHTINWYARYVRFLFFIPIFYFLIRMDRYNRPETIAINTSLIAILFSIWEIYFPQALIWQHRDMPHALNGVLNSIHFGNYAALLFSLILSLVIFGQRTSQPRIMGLQVVATLLLTGCWLSLSRGAWICIPLIFLIILGLKLRNEGLKAFAKAIRTCLLICIVSGALGWQGISNGVERFNDQYLYPLVDQAYEPKIGDGQPRLEIWRVAISTWRENPIFGIGYDRFGEETYKYKDSMKSRYMITQGGRAHHAHNSYLDNLVSGGLIGFIGFLAVIATPILFFLGRLTTVEDSRYWVAVSGLCISILFSIACLTESFFKFSNFMMFYIFVIAYFSASATRKELM